MKLHGGNTEWNKIITWFSINIIQLYLTSWMVLLYYKRVYGVFCVCCVSPVYFRTSSQAAIAHHQLISLQQSQSVYQVVLYVSKVRKHSFPRSHSCSRILQWLPFSQKHISQNIPLLSTRPIFQHFPRFPTVLGNNIILIPLYCTSSSQVMLGTDSRSYDATSLPKRYSIFSMQRQVSKVCKFAKTTTILRK